MSRLIATVHLPGPDGIPISFGPRDDVPEWARTLITNPAAWTQEPLGPAEDDEAGAAVELDDPAITEDDQDPGSAGELGTDEGEGTQAGAPPGDETAQPEPDGVGEPPRTGRGSGREPWARYAHAAGVHISDDMNRDDIIAAVDAADQD